RLVILDERSRHGHLLQGVLGVGFWVLEDSKVSDQHLAPGTRHLRGVPHVEEYLHRAAADHALLAGLVGGEAEAVARRAARAQTLARLGPDLCLDAAAAHRAGHAPALAAEHLRAPALPPRAAPVRHGRSLRP